MKTKIMIGLFFLLVSGCGGDWCDEKKTVYVEIDGKTEKVEVCVVNHDN